MIPLPELLGVSLGTVLLDWSVDAMPFHSFVCTTFIMLSKQNHHLLVPNSSTCSGQYINEEL